MVGVARSRPNVVRRGAAAAAAAGRAVAVWARATTATIRYHARAVGDRRRRVVSELASVIPRGLLKQLVLAFSQALIWKRARVLACGDRGSRR